MSRKQFAAYRSGMKTDTIVGMGVVVRFPTGDYMEDQLNNLGNNRYTFRPQAGINHTWGTWTAEATGEVAFYTDIDELYNGKKLAQEPTYIIHGHLTRTFRPGLWVVAGVGYDYGGESTVNGVEKDDKKQDIAWGLRISCPINRHAGLKFSCIGSRKLESTGLDSDTLAASLSISW